MNLEPPPDLLAAPAGIPGSALSGPFPVGEYAAALQRRLREFAHVQVFGEVFGFRTSRARVYFELRDAHGALPCSMWRNEFEALGVQLSDGVQVVAAGGCDYYPGHRNASPSFSFAVADLRLAGEGDLLAQLERLRRSLAGEGLFAPQKALPRPALPRAIGVVTGEGGKARDDVLAGLARRGWEGRLVWAFAPVQDRHAAPAITRALQDLAAARAVDVIIVARGGGSLADLFAFCDETLCRTVALLPVPVIASVGHHTDRTLIDDVAAIACSTPTHAAEAAVPVDCRAARAELRAHALRLQARGRGAVVARARHLAALSGAPARHVARHRARLHQQTRELRAAARRRLADDGRGLGAVLAGLVRKATAASGAAARGAQRAGRDAVMLERAAGAAHRRQATALERFSRALDAHDPQRTLERGYALVTDPAGELVASADRARTLDAMTVRFHDGELRLGNPRAERPAGRGQPHIAADAQEELF